MKYNLQQILDNLRIDSLNEMQVAVQDAAQHPNIILLSPTGSGKTLAFLLSVLSGLDANVKSTQAMIVVPSRELALQIESVWRKMVTGFKVTLCYGGHKREIEETNLVEPPALIIGTPGRLADHIRRGNITTSTIHTLVLDEFDKTLELGFVEELEAITGELTGIRNRILTSATEAITVPLFLNMEDAHRLVFLTGDEAEKPMLDIKQLLSPQKDKIETLAQFICTTGARSTIVFCNHRESVERVHEALSQKSIVSTFYHGAMEQRDREIALAKFRNGSVNILITTDLAARGLDIPHIRYIIHYHLPLTEEIFTHRNGRTARMEASGTAVLLVGPDEKLPFFVNPNIEQLLVDASAPLPDKPKWTTLYVAAGKKDKVNKVDIVGFFAQQGGLKSEDIGLIEVKDFASFVALRRHHVPHTLQLIKNQKLKGKKIKIDVAK